MGRWYRSHRAIKKMHGPFESGVSIVNIHSGQPDQGRVIDFYGEHVIPSVKQPA
jgi:hypothetical protein